MDQDIVIKCQIEDHENNVKLVCFDEMCKENRLYCMQCNRNGIHISHNQHQYELPILFEHIQQVNQECDDFIKRFNKLMDSIQQSFYQLIQGIRTKYQRSKQQFLKFNSKQMNSFFAKTILFKSFVSKIEIQMVQSSNQFQDSLKQLYQDLKLTQLNYYQISDQDIQKSQQLFTKAYKLWDDDNYKEAIKVLDEVLIFNSKNQLALWCKASCLIIQQ